MKTIHPLRLFTNAGLVSLALIYVLLWVNTIHDPKQSTGSDFIGFYSFGRIAQTDGFENIYNVNSQESIEEGVTGFTVAPEFYTHVPFISAIAAFIVNADYINSFIRWAIVLLLLNTASASILVQTLPRGMFNKEETITLLAGIFLFFPTFSAFMNGQDDAILLLGLAIWLWGLFSQKPFIAGLGLSLTTVRPQTALFLAIPFFFKQRKVFWGFALGGAILVIVSWALVKTEGMISFINSLRVIESTIWIEPHTLDMPTLSGIIRRNFQTFDVAFARNLIWGSYLAGIIGFCIVWYKSKEILGKQAGLLALFSILLVPYAHYHDLVILLVPIMCLIHILSIRKIIDTSWSVILPLIVSLIAFAGFMGAGSLKFPLIYFVMLILGYLLLFPDRITRIPMLRKGATNV